MIAKEARKKAENFRSEQKNTQYDRYIRHIKKASSLGDFGFFSTEKLTKETENKLKDDGYQIYYIMGSSHDIRW